MHQTPEQPRLDPIQQLSHHAYYQLIHTLCQMLPPPLTDTPEAMLTRNQAAIAKIAAMAPVNDDEADVAAHCVVARGQAEGVMRQIRASAGDARLVMRLTAQYALMERTGVSLRNQLLRLQTARFKREASNAAADTDGWTKHIAVRLMQQALEEASATSVPAVQPLASSSAAPHPAPAAVSMPVAPPSLVQPPAAAAARMPEARLPPPSAQAAPAAAPATKSAAPSRNLLADAEHYASVYPYRAAAIRRYGGLPPNCDFGPPDDDLVSAIVAGDSLALRALDAPTAATG